MHNESQTDWERVRREAAEDGPIPYDDEDREEGLYDPNDDDAVAAAWATGIVTVTRRGPDGVYVRRIVTLELPPELVEQYEAQGEDWKARMGEALRRGLEKPENEPVEAAKPDTEPVEVSAS